MNLTAQKQSFLTLLDLRRKAFNEVLNAREKMEASTNDTTVGDEGDLLDAASAIFEALDIAVKECRGALLEIGVQADWLYIPMA